MGTNVNEYVIEKDPKYNVPTEELLKTFPIIFQTKAPTDLAKKFQNRMLNGFNTWNKGYDAWEHWGEVLYHKDSLYNVHGVHFTLEEYQKSMNVALSATDIQMGDFQNMIFSDDWTAIRYETVNIDRKTGERTPADVTEFVRFGDFGERGAKVEEGWGGVKCETFTGMSYFQTEEERQAERKFLDELIAIQLKDTDNLEEKYPVYFPTSLDEKYGVQMKEIILKDFENYNNGYESYSQWIDELLTEDAVFDLRRNKFNRAELKEAIKQDFASSPVRVRINNILTSEDWTAVHFWEVVTLEDGTKDVNNHMHFYHFVETINGLKVDKAWAR